MTEERLQRLVERIKYDTIVMAHSCENDPEVRFRLWVLNVPRERLCAVEDEVFGEALNLYPDEVLPVLIGVASPEKTASIVEAS